MRHALAYRTTLFLAFCLLLLAVASPAGWLNVAGQGDKQDKQDKKAKATGYRPRQVSLNRPGKSDPLTGPQQGKALDLASAYLKQNRSRLGVGEADLSDLRVTAQYASKSNGATHIYMKQTHDGLDVLGANLSVNVSRDGEIINVNGGLIKELGAAANTRSPSLTAVQAVEAAARFLDLKVTAPLAVIEQPVGNESATVLDTGGVALEPIRVKLAYQPVSESQMRLAWNIELYEASGEHWWNMSVDAVTGEVLATDDQVDQDNWPTLTTHGAAPARSLRLGVLRPTVAPGVADGSSYRVFEMPKESPSDGPRTLVMNPADMLASPFGWHDTNGVAGPEFTRTRGNNVHAYTDIDANNVADPGSDPDGTATLTFDFPLDLSMNPDTYRPAAVANLFYWNNIVHDVFYQYGFNEAAGNFQVNNYGRGGVGGDDVRAEAQDGSGTNNANFGTGVEGVRPRMQMFVWTNPLPNFVTVNTPAGIAGDYPATGAAFGPTLITTGPKTANVTLVDDGVDTGSDACEPLVGFPAGNIALLDRGTCTFVVKVKNAQNAGAIAVIVANNAAGSPITMGGADPTITIPSVMVSLDNGNLYKVNLPVNATLKANPVNSINRDSDLDSGVIAHEYGHGISNRLTGGPAVVNCLNNAEQMGEGWSDWLGLVLTTDPADTATTPRGIGTYLIYQPSTGNGIRPTPYTTDMTVNPATYASVADTVNISQPHGIGYVWSTMLWEMYWNLVHEYGYNPNVYDAWNTGGNNLAIQLVMDGMKLQTCRPGFVNGRDAILQADRLLTDGANQCLIWKAFAKRGLGVSADQGSNLSRTDGVEAFDMPPTCGFAGYVGPIRNRPAVNQAQAGSTVPIIFSLGGDLGLDIFNMGYPASRQINCTSMAAIGTLEPTVAMGSSGLTYDPLTDRYNYPWKTSKSWAGTCRELIVRFADGTPRNAFFNFK